MNQYEAADATNSIRVVVTPRARVLDIGISESWRKKLAPDQFAKALLGAYHSAVRTAFTAEYENGGPVVAERPVDDDANAETQVDWYTGIRTRLRKIDQRLRDLQDHEPRGRDAELRSPNGYFTLRMQGGGLVDITAPASALRSAGTELLRTDALTVFRSAGLTAEA
ncbi:hypothetical protein [Amycolatopsis sp. YIM 10]|uniref:hypothetical protein n=1 Tax=Amycolatopsis sp. YIM 10 TaxID=2653857 RepID=UPI0012907A7F|nr:hypothetical protein [Amycolatopsis sp. YIM 10]QFU87179.1 hypothetical protein YIM_09865 [Amycolatopsis sp. YIM 10]